jgi:hypothetical protein
LVHDAFAGQGVQVVAGQDTTIVSVLCWRAGLQEELVAPWGQVACRASKSIVNEAWS